MAKFNNSYTLLLVVALVALVPLLLLRLSSEESLPTPVVSELDNQPYHEEEPRTVEPLSQESVVNEEANLVLTPVDINVVEREVCVEEPRFTSMAIPATRALLQLNDPPTLSLPTAKNVVNLTTPSSVVETDTVATIYTLDRTAGEAAFALKGEWMGGLSASIYSFETDNATLLLLLNSIEANGNVTSIKPYAGYFYADNRCVGIRFGYTHYDGRLGLAELDLGESNDISMTLPNVDLRSNNYSYAAFHRSYVALDERGRLGMFSDVELSYTHGTTSLSYATDGERTVADSRRQTVDFVFNPGVAFYLFPNVCTTLSFGMGGFNYSRIEQLDELGAETGWYENSSLSFKFDILAINFGITFHFW